MTPAPNHPQKSKRKGLKVYRLDIPGGEDNVDDSEHFTSLKAARTRRREIIEDGHAVEGTLAIERLEMVTLPTRALVLAILDRRGYVADVVEVVPAWTRV